MSERGPIILSVVAAGSEKFVRYRIADSYLRFWSGKDWVADEEKGLMYASSNEACVEVQRLLLLDYVDRPVRHYRAPVYLDLFSDQKIPLSDLRRWAVKVSKLLMDNNHGNGPGKALGLCRIEWSELEELKDEGSV